MTMLAEALDRETLGIISDGGDGRAFVVVFDDTNYADLASAVAERITQTNRCLVVQSPAVDTASWSELSEALAKISVERSIRQASYLCFGGASTLAQNLALNEPKAVRTLVVVDATPRPHPTRLERTIDRLEARLPMGLPLRLGSSGFNVRSYLHRLRCPLLVVTTRRASGFVRDESDVVAAEAPTAWRTDIETPDAAIEAERLADAVVAFQETPVKCPQKNLQR